ncbi:hypothetical protein ACQPZK_20790 [Micromonospora sp. CA-249363]|uniref:hypothetical protein n=1 Tax=Micromonospora sp. CA-249363 TaxID=3239963 RepID=UPI003D923B7E
MAGNPQEGAPANYDGGQVISMYPIDVYEATFYRRSLDFVVPEGIPGGSRTNLGVNVPPRGLWIDDDGTMHVPTGDDTDTLIKNPLRNIDESGSEGGYSYGSVPAKLDAIAGAFDTIAQIWDGLKLSWIGDSADAAKELQDKLDQVQKRLFGQKIQPLGDTPGVIGQMSSVAASAASVMSSVEETNTRMFEDFANAIDWKPLPPEELDDEAEASNDQKPPPPPEPPKNEDRLFGPITETF